MSTTRLMRKALEPFYADCQDAHPGLLIQRGLAVHDDDDKDARTRHIRRICAIPASSFYRNAFQRWRQSTGNALRFTQVELALESRLFIGLTGGGMLETGCAISHSYGMPYIPSTSIKGVVRAHVHQSPFATKHRKAVDDLFGAAADPKQDDQKGLAGLVTFHDAWWVPGSSETPLVEEVVTSHHPGYYGREGQVAASDCDSPIPNAQIAVQGRFLFVLEGEAGWRDLAEQMLTAALSQRGIGAKTRTGYGLFDSQVQAPKGPVCAWVDDTIVRLAAEHNASEEDTLRGKHLAQAWQAIDDAKRKAAALADIRSRLEQRGWWDAPQGKSAKAAKKIYTEQDGA